MALGQVNQLRWRRMAQNATASTTRRRRETSRGYYIEYPHEFIAVIRFSLLQGHLEGEDEQASNREEGGRRRAGADGGSGALRVITRSLTSRVGGRVGRSTVNRLGESDECFKVAVR